MKKILLILNAIALFCFLLLIGYHLICPRPELKKMVFLAQVSGKSLPKFSDDLNGEGLREAINLQIEKLRGGNLSEKVNFGEITVTRRRILSSLEYFQKLLDEKGIVSLIKDIPKHFLVLQDSGLNCKGDVLFTGYYQPILDARRSSEGEYQYPIYRIPADLQVIDLGEFNPAYAGEKIGLRVENGIIKPYFDRKAIDKDLVLGGRGLELLYLKDFIDRYMLQVQGSGILKLENYEEIKVKFSASNGFPYVSLGKLLTEQGKIPKDKISLKAIREYFRKNPEEIKEYLYQNRRYIFFEEYSGKVKGSEGVELTAGRSIATDKSIFPGGGLAFIICRKPLLNTKGEVIKWLPMNRFMIDQDTGAAINGPGRVDIFWGMGKEAGEMAGSIKETGKLYYLLLKEEKG